MQPDGTVHSIETSEKINDSGRPSGPIIISQVYMDSDLQVQRITDGAGQPVQFTISRQGSRNFCRRQYGSIPAGGKLVETVESIERGPIVRGKEPGSFVYHTLAPWDLKNPTHRRETLRLPAGTVLMNILPADSVVSTNGGRIEITFDKIIPAGHPLPVKCAYRLAKQ